MPGPAVNLYMLGVSYREVLRTIHGFSTNVWRGGDVRLGIKKFQNSRIFRKEYCIDMPDMAQVQFTVATTTVYETYDEHYWRRISELKMLMI